MWLRRLIKSANSLRRVNLTSQIRKSAISKSDCRIEIQMENNFLGKMAPIITPLSER